MVQLQMNLNDDGFVVLPGVLTDSEIARLRSETQSILDKKGHAINGGTVLPNAAAEAEALSWIFCHDRILEAVRLHTGLNELVFTAEADAHRNFLVGGWHKDTGESSMKNGYFDCDWTSSSDCRVYKVALYLQDHLDGSGLTVRPGTTANQSLVDGDAYPVPVRAGDAVLFDVRITHRGNAPTSLDRAILRLGNRILPSRHLGILGKARRWKNQLRRKPDRLAIYFAFGMPNERSEIFANRNMQRQLRQSGTPRFVLPAELERRFSISGVRVVNIDYVG
jgi:hypothetical protein